MIEQAAGRGDHDVRARLQFIILPAITHAAKDDGGFQIREPGIIAKAGFHLGRELARGLQNEGARSAVLVGPQLGEDRQGERCGFTSTRLGTANDIASRQDEGNGARLDGSWVCITSRLDSVQYRLCQA